MPIPSRHAPPVYVPSDGPTLMLNRLRLGDQIEDGARREQFIQDLVHDRPEVIPMADIEPAFAPLIPICRELPTPAGYLDNLWLTPAGGIVLGECKLVKNPQARREVVSQALDYARAISTWGYEDLDAGVRKALGPKAQSIWSLISPHTDLTEDQFVDAVGRRLKLGRFLVLIIGDGIQEGMEALTAFLQLHAGLHAGIALVDLSIWHGVGGGLLVVPRIPMRTVLIERGIVTVDASGAATVNPPQAQVRTTLASKEPRAVTASEPEFFDQLEARRPSMAAALQTFILSLADLGVGAEYRKTVLLRLATAGEETATLVIIDSYGKCWFGSAWASLNKIGLSTIADAYQAGIANLAGGQVRRYQTATPPEVMGSDGKSIDVTVLMDKLAALRSIIEHLATAMAEGVERR